GRGDERKGVMEVGDLRPELAYKGHKIAVAVLCPGGFVQKRCLLKRRVPVNLLVVPFVYGHLMAMRGQQGLFSFEDDVFSPRILIAFMNEQNSQGGTSLKGGRKHVELTCRPDKPHMSDDHNLRRSSLKLVACPIRERK